MTTAESTLSQAVTLGPRAQQALARLIVKRDTHGRLSQEASAEINETVGLLRESLGLDETWILLDVVTGFVKEQSGT